MKFKEIVNELCSYSNEKEWFEFKENWYEADKLGEYISALSNAAAMIGKKQAYFVWGINDKTHEIVGTKFNQYKDYKDEPLQNYLARNLTPSIKFEFVEEIIEEKRIVILIIPAAKNIPTSFNNSRFFRIGSSKVNLKDYPEREKGLFKILEYGLPTITNTESNYQELTFSKLFGYYGSKGINLNEKTFKNNLNLTTENGKYNILAQLLSDDSKLPLRVSIFEGKTKADKLFSVREFGFDCLLYSLDELLRYGDVLNIIQADERNRIVERKDVPLFDDDAFREAIINAVLHNKWVDGNEPMISVFSDRIEILSRGTLAPMQTIEGFYSGASVPVNEKLAEIFLQLHISEKSGRGIPKITSVYGKDAIEFIGNNIIVKIPFNWINEEKKEDNNVKTYNELTENRKKIMSEINKNPYITQEELSDKLKISTTSIENNISYLKENSYIKRYGANKNGYWEILK